MSVGVFGPGSLVSVTAAWGEAYAAGAMGGATLPSAHDAAPPRQNASHKEALYL